MQKRWWILILLFFVRISMAFQFQAVGALSPAFQETFAVSIADIGILIGLYFSPGLFLAMPGGALGKRFGDKQVVLAGLALMAAGAVLMAISTHWEGQLIGRLTAGLGGVFLNVLMTKMVADWFSGKEISFSLAVFVNSWPVGIALALIVLPLVADAAGLTFALVIVAILIVAGFIGLAFFYTTPFEEEASENEENDKLRGTLLWAVIAAGAIWGLYNAGLAIVFSFGPELFVARGMSLPEAGSTTSIILWLLAIGGSFAGWLIDWSGKRNLILIVGNIGFAIFVYVGAWSTNVLLNVIAIGIFSGVAVGAMMSLPASILSPQTRAVGMGVFFTINYFCSMIGTIIAGEIAERTNDIAITYSLAAILIVASVLFLPVFQMLKNSITNTND